MKMNINVPKTNKDKLFNKEVMLTKQIKWELYSLQIIEIIF